MEAAIAESDVFFEDHIGEIESGGPVLGLSGGFDPVGAGRETEHFSGIAFPITALNGVPVPGRFVPQRTILFAVIGLLDEPSVIPMIDEITIRATFGDPGDPCAPLGLDSNTDGTVVDEEEVVGRRGSGGEGGETGEYNKASAQSRPGWAEGLHATRECHGGIGLRS